MQKQSGNFLLQALLALTLIIGFMPLFTNKIATQEQDARMNTAVKQIEMASTAAKIYIQENLNDINFETTTISGDKFTDLLEPYGLPLGFIPKTSYNQDLSLVIVKSDTEIYAYIQGTGGNMTENELAQQARRIGFYGSYEDNIIYAIVPLSEAFQDLVPLKERNLTNSGFLVDLNMGDFDIENTSMLLGRNGEFETTQIKNLSLLGIETTFDERNEIKNMNSNIVVFQSDQGDAALTINTGLLQTDFLSARTFSEYGSASNLLAENVAVYDFTMSAGSTSFTGPADWEVRGDVIANDTSFSTERLEITSFIDASGGQDVFISPDSLEYSTNTGITTEYIYTANITMRDQTSSAILQGQTGAIILDIRPAGTSLLPDALVSWINNDEIKILKEPLEQSSDTISCKEHITTLGGTYNAKSVSQYIICRYLFLQALEERINAKECLLQGGSNCV